MTIRYVNPSASTNGSGESWDDPFNSTASALEVSDDGDEVWVKFGYEILTGALEVSTGVSLYGGFQEGLTGTSGSVAGRLDNYVTTINGAGTYQGIVLTGDNALVDGFYVFNCTGTDGGGIVILGGASSYYWGSNLLVDGNMEYVIAGYWSEFNADAVKTTSNPHSGNRCLQVAANGSPCYVYQSILEVGHTYRFSGYARGATTAVKDGTVSLDTGAGGSTWEALSDSSFVATTTEFRLYNTEGETDAYFDDFSVQEYLSNSGAITGCTVQNCVVSQCSATTGGGIFVSNATTFTIDNVKVSYCTATDGAGIALEDAYIGTISATHVYNNTSSTIGGGIYLHGDNASNVVDIEECYIQNNTSSSNGAGIHEADNASAAHTVNRCVITGNTSSASGGVYVTSGTVTGTNCTIADNAVRGWENNGGTSVVVNCIIWDNTTESSGTITMTYTDIQGGHAGTGNVDDDPLFHAAGGRLQYYDLDGTSGATDSGNSGATGFISTDILGRSMYDHPGVANTGAGGTAYTDMGAYEFQGTPINTLDMSLYFIDCEGATTADDYLFRMYAIVRVPTIPTDFMGSRDVMSPPFTSVKIAKHRVSSEIEIDESDSTLDEWVAIDNVLSAHRRTDAGTTYTSPTRAANYDALTKKSDDDHVAENNQLPVGIDSQYPGLEGYFRYVIVEMCWQPFVNDAGDVMHIYNVDINQFWEDYDYNGFAVEAHPATTLIAPDMPLSAYHVRSILQDSLLKILHEGRNSFSIPVFGYYKVIVV